MVWISADGRTIRESGLALIFKKDLSLTLYSSQECTRRHKMTESIFSARLLHAVQGENKGKKRRQSLNKFRIPFPIYRIYIVGKKALFLLFRNSFVIHRLSADLNGWYYMRQNFQKILLRSLRITKEKCRRKKKRVIIRHYILRFRIWAHTYSIKRGRKYE